MTELYQGSLSLSARARPYCRWLDNATSLSSSTIYAGILIVPVGSNVLPREKLEKIISSRAAPARTYLIRHGITAPYVNSISS